MNMACYQLDRIDEMFDRLMYLLMINFLV